MNILCTQCTSSVQEIKAIIVSSIITPTEGQKVDIKWKKRKLMRIMYLHEGINQHHDAVKLPQIIFNSQRHVQVNLLLPERKLQYRSYFENKLFKLYLSTKIKQKQPSVGVLITRCSENVQQVYRRTPMPKCGFNKVAKQIY